MREKRIMKRKPVLYKTLVFGVIVLFFGIVIQPAFANSINKEENKLTSTGFKNYFNCKIRTSEAFDGRALIFPGLLISFLRSANVKIAFGKLVAYEHEAESIYFDKDEYGSKFRYAFVFCFNGYFVNYFYKP